MAYLGNAKYDVHNYIFAFIVIYSYLYPYLVECFNVLTDFSFSERFMFPTCIVV